MPSLEIPPPSAVLAATVTAVHAAPAMFALAAFAMPGLFPLHGGGMVVLLLLLVLAGLAVGPVAGLAWPTALAWWGGVAANVLAAVLWFAPIAWMYFSSAEAHTVDGGLVPFMLAMCGAPMVLLAGLGLVLLVQEPTQHHYRRRRTLAGSAPTAEVHNGPPPSRWHRQLSGAPRR